MDGITMHLTVIDADGNELHARPGQVPPDAIGAIVEARTGFVAVPFTAKSAVIDGNLGPTRPSSSRRSTPQQITAGSGRAWSGGALQVAGNARQIVRFVRARAGHVPDQDIEMTRFAGGSSPSPPISPTALIALRFG
jgi:hypothetical protein